MLMLMLEWTSSLYCNQLKTCCEIIIIDNQLNTLEKRNYCSLIELIEMNQNSQVLSDLNNKGHDEIVETIKSEIGAVD